MKSALMFLLTGLLSCGTGAPATNGNVLSRCWKVVDKKETASGQIIYEVELEALVIPGTEGSAFARSDRCKNVRLHFSEASSEADQVLRVARARGSREHALGIGIAGNAVISLLGTRDHYHLRSKVIKFTRYRIMSDRETRDFINRFQIG
jgi:hypothetical protein